MPVVSKEQLEKWNAEMQKNSDDEFREFEKCLKVGKCYLCNKPFEEFSEKIPCIHWLLRPDGFKKKHFPLVYKKYSLWHIQPYLRWLANSKVLFGNINDLAEEGSSKKVIETTMRYGCYEWSFSCSESDFSGHADSEVGKVPHYHFQMRIDGLPFIDYTDFHIPLSKYDLWIIAVRRGEIPSFKHTNGRGAGMQEILDNLETESALDEMRSSDKKEEGVFQIDTFIEAKEGHSISSDEIAGIIEESKRTGVTLAKLARKLKNVKIVTVIQPGPSVPEKASRKPRKNR